MKRLLSIAAVVLTATACTAIRDLRSDDNPYEEPPFYAKYLNTGSTLDANITRTLDAVRQDPKSAELHNTLGALLVEKRFPADAEREFERAVNADGRYYPAWYNLGLVRAGRGDEIGARRAFSKTVDLRPGHAPALFQLGLIQEQRKHKDRAIELYAKAYSINPALLEVQVNPRIVDTKLIHLALLKMYPDDHTRRSMQFQGMQAPMPAPTTPPPAATPVPASKARGPNIAPTTPVTDPLTPDPAPAITPPTTTPGPAATSRRRRPTPPPATETPAPPPPATTTAPPGQG
ncbi:MAG TPA: tetratricopeptide repeat protein [Thermoanaerobaculia bacterium]|nr:tetratricopeptide repeat protein [Thermoanaerobaculia bacterium]